MEVRPRVPLWLLFCFWLMLHGLYDTPMDAETRDLIATLFEQVFRLQQQLDESALIEVSLIATLKELVPGFGPKFEQMHIASKTMFSKPNDEDLARVRAAVEELKTKQEQKSKPASS